MRLHSGMHRLFQLFPLRMLQQNSLNALTVSLCGAIHVAQPDEGRGKIPSIISPQLWTFQLKTAEKHSVIARDPADITSNDPPHEICLGNVGWKSMVKFHNTPGKNRTFREQRHD